MPHGAREEEEGLLNRLAELMIEEQVAGKRVRTFEKSPDPVFRDDTSAPKVR